LLVAAATGIAGICLTLYACRDAAEPLRPNTSSPSFASVSSLKGEWSDTFSTEVVALHASLVPLAAGGAGVLVWGHAGVPHLWNLSESVPTFTSIGEPAELFCAGHTFLPDGSLLVVGGHDEVKGDAHGIPNVSRFVDGGWVDERPMSYGRWYPTATALENGDVLVYAGTDDDAVDVLIPELYGFTSRSWTKLTGASKQLPWYPRSFLDPSRGTVFYAGDNRGSRWLDVNGNGGTGKWSANVAYRLVADRSYGSAAMYEPGKILYAGGGGGNASTGVAPTETAETIDLNQPTPYWTATGSMTYARRQMNLTILADGKVLATGGTSSPGFTIRALGRREAEIWDPVTGTWSLMAAEAIIRVYHGVSLLLPDGRVMSAGSGDGKGLPRETSGQIFSPPYLFRPDGGLAARPRIARLSTAALHYGQQFNVVTPNAASIAKVHLIRFSSVTHAFNQGQLLYRAAFVRSSGLLTVTGPASGRLAPPGPYLLFIVNSSGVPSVGQVVSLSK
jgi:hypothetical protein